jgi:2-aminoethylphosphonate-pyruvate transaminase
MTGPDRTILLNPGPVTLTERVRNALTRGDWCHREPEFAKLTRDINTRLARVYRETAGRYRAVMLTGSGTAAVEAMCASIVPRDTETLVVANGVYGERIAAMLGAHARPHTIVRAEWGAPIDIAAVTAALDANAAIRHVLVVHHETTTGRLNDLSALGTLCRERGLRLLIDAVSSFGAEAIDFPGWNVAALAATANKCLHGVPGIAFVLARNDVWDSELVDAGSVYLDLGAYYRGQYGDGFSPFTQAVQPAFALQEALRELEEAGGWEQRRSIYRRRAGRIATTLLDLGLETYLPPAEFSCVLWSWRLPAGVDYAAVHKFLKNRGFVVYAGQGNLGSEIFRIAHMGDIREPDLARLESALRDCFAGAAR